jgi:hypothetical protein
MFTDAVYVPINGVWIGEPIYWPLITTRFEITSNYSATANLHKSKITTAPDKPFSACCIFSSRFLAMASNSGDALVSRAQALPSPIPIQNCLPTESKSYVKTDGQSASLSWNKARIRGLRRDFYWCQIVAGLLVWGALSEERTGLSFTIVAGPRQRSHFWVRVPWDSWSYEYFTVSNSRPSFSSHPTTRRVTVEVFEPASRWGCLPTDFVPCL